MKNFNFESAAVPVITEAELARLAKTRTLRRQMTVVAVGTALMLVAMLILCAAAFSLSPALGAAFLALPIYTVLWGGTVVFVFVFLQKRAKIGVKAPY